MSITISQQYSKIGIQTTPGKWEMESTQPKIQMHQKHAKVNIDTELPKVLIDQYDCFAEEGLKNNIDFIKERSQVAQQNLAEYISKKNSAGDILGAIQNKGGNPFAQIAKNESKREHEFGLGTLPISRPKFQVTGSIKIQAEPNAQGVTNGVEYTLQPGKLDINYTRGSVETYLRQKASIEIHYEPDKKIDTKI